MSDKKKEKRKSNVHEHDILKPESVHFNVITVGNVSGE